MKNELVVAFEIEYWKQGIVYEGGINNTGICDIAHYAIIKKDWN